MTYFLLSITNRCNKACNYCVVKPWLNNHDFPDKITATDLISFLEKEFCEGDVVELTGGEPTLFRELETLLDWLKEHGAKVIIRTNGLNLRERRKKYDNIVVVLAKHDSSDSYMSERKTYLLPHDLVLDAIPDSIKQKEGGKPIFIPSNESPYTSHPFTRSLFISADGKVKAMACCSVDMGTVWDYKLLKYQMCDKCDTMLGAWNLINRIGNKTFKKEVA
ncbi:MAG: radical SAM protein [Fibromonadaceae bacterium]|jgi:MoaA/NifB/PqqE/SkfB family radical SAM enzyme|nr:radical SAM protein [Fibromonadaceae bacterium]